MNDTMELFISGLIRNLWSRNGDRSIAKVTEKEEEKNGSSLQNCSPEMQRVLFQTKILGKIVRAVPESMHVRKEFTSCPSPKPFDTSGEKSSKIFLPPLTSFYNEMSSPGTTFPRLYLEPIRLTSSQSGEIRKRKRGKKEEAVKRITGMINSRVAVAEARSEERAWRTTRVLIITIIRGQLRR